MTPTNLFGVLTVQLDPGPETISDLSIQLAKASLHMPPRARVTALALADAAPRPILLGRHLIQSGMKPDARFRPLLDAAFEAQLDGAFADEAGGLGWLQHHLASVPPAPKT